jgi:hypothetical protein
MIKITSERIELVVPEMLVVGNPFRCFLHGRGVDFAAHDASFFQPFYESCCFQHGQMFHEAGQRHVMRMRELADRAAAGFQLREYTAARRIGQRGKHEIEVGVFIVNHKV